MTHPIATTGEASLFVLDDEGVFFFAPRQELYVFNTTATFLWCCIEEGLSASETAAAYSDAFGLPVPQAQAHVADLLNQWWGLGYIEDPGIAPASEIPFTTALARLLVNPSLRTRFARSPAEVSHRLAIRGSDVAAFQALDPLQLEVQASRTRPERGAREQAAPGTETLFSSMVSDTRTLPEYAAECRLLGLSRPALEHDYRLLSTNFRVRFSSPAPASSVHPALAHMAVAPSSPIDVCLDVVEGEHGYVIMDGVVPVHHCREPGELAPRMKGLLRQLALNRDDFFLELHAGVVSDGTSCIVLPGAPGSGKTTLTAGLVFSGFEYFSDEVALLDEESLRLRPVPLGLGIKPGAVETLAELFPEVRQLAVHSREDGQQVRYLSLSATRTAPVGISREAKWLIFPRYGRSLDTALRPIGRPEALRRLMHECMVLPRLLDETRVEKLVRWMRQLHCYELPMNSLDRAVELVKGLCLRGGMSHGLP